MAPSSVFSALSRSSFWESRYSLRSDCSLNSSIAARLIEPRRWMRSPICATCSCHTRSLACSGMSLNSSSRINPDSLTCSSKVWRRTMSSCEAILTSSSWFRLSCNSFSISVRLWSKARSRCSSSSTRERAVDNCSSVCRRLSRWVSSSRLKLWTGSSSLWISSSSCSRLDDNSSSWLCKREIACFVEANSLFKPRNCISSAWLCSRSSLALLRISSSCCWKFSLSRVNSSRCPE